MCGIAGWAHFGAVRRGLGDPQRLVAAMARTLAGRGPDAQGTWADKCVALGHRRLAVIDPAGGSQPMSAATPDGPVTITYSGEAYNYAELRRELRARGHRFGTASDTEVVLRGYLEWGAGLASRLNGMFAFAIWDGRRDVLLLVRDRLGVKPLYYYPTREGLLFASEPKAILEHPLALRVVDEDGLRRAVGYALTIPGVPWAGMVEVTPGDVVTVDRSGAVATPYWRLATREHDDDLPTTVAHVRQLLGDIVSRQLVADVPIGVLLSGGLDSSTLTALAAEAPTRPVGGLVTYDVDFTDYGDHFVADGERAAPDAPYVDEVVAQLGTRHRRISLTSETLSQRGLRSAAVHAYDQPPGSGDRDRSMYLLFRAIRASSTVALSGESADELFGGYGWFHDPVVQATPAFPWVASLYETYSPAPGSLSPQVEAALDLPGYLADEFASAATEVEHLDGACAHERRMRVASYVHLTRSLRVLLDRKDRLSMASGLEVRVPYCDHQLVEYVYNAPWRMKVFDEREKSLLRAAAHDLLPRSVVERVKTAYPSIRHPAYDQVLRAQAAAVAHEADDPVFAVVSRSWLADAARAPAPCLPARTRNTLEWTLNLSAWLAASRPSLCLR